MIKIYNNDNIKILKKFPDNYIDLTVTSPPYDNLRTYKGFSWDFENLAKELYRVTKKGGVIVWVVGDATIKGSETGTSFKQALYFKEIGFNLHDTMIYYRQPPFPSNTRYNQVFEYMFILSKGKPKCFNPCVRQKKSQKSFNKNVKSKTYRNKNGITVKVDKKAIERLTLAQSSELKTADNIWYVPSGFMISSKDKIAFQHPATFPEQLANDHIISWSNPNDLVLDPFMGSGTTLKMAKINKRNAIGIESSKEYCKIAVERLKAV